ncbi:ribosome-associated protein [Pseudoxanthomonas sp. GM95]|uniref:ribosome biogenesis factor YjgA n=1 Tax=Pseudoxanthomonas sp. GM95 TaxID=1881043 RepID=UPI0008C2245E|nr:ribosome biogenesis factor YjgA [Pseudoxanthomonas sp. GM95]SEL79654.1 ribosome-associated protein [Pseudoxanthomonas sp. GM95]
MRGRDPETGEFRGPSRTQQRQGALEVRSLAEQLVALTPAQLAKLPLSEELADHVADTKKVTSHIAHKRQLQFLAKQMRKEDDETLEAIRDALDVSGDAARIETGLMHQAEGWRERLLDDPEALTQLLDEYPDADRQRLRQLIRNVAEERKRNKPPASYRELYREVRGLLADADAGDDTPDDDEEE